MKSPVLSFRGSLYKPAHCYPASLQRHTHESSVQQGLGGITLLPTQRGMITRLGTDDALKSLKETFCHHRVLKYHYFLFQILLFRNEMMLLNYKHCFQVSSNTRSQPSCLPGHTPPPPPDNSLAAGSTQRLSLFQAITFHRLTVTQPTVLGNQEEHSHLLHIVQISAPHES